jgi:hypothetical protein
MKNYLQKYSYLQKEKVPKKKKNNTNNHIFFG